MIRPSGMESEQREERLVVSASVRSGRKLVEQRLKSMNMRSVMVVSAGGGGGGGGGEGEG